MTDIPTTLDWLRLELSRCTADRERVTWAKMYIEASGVLKPRLPKKIPVTPSDPLALARLRLGEVRKFMSLKDGDWPKYREEERRLLAEISRLDGKGERTTPAEEATGLTDDELDAAIEEARRRGHPGVVPA